MCVGRRPWAGMSHAAVVHAVCVQQRRLEFGPDADEGAAMLARACMARDPEERPSFREVLEVLEPLGAALESGSVAAVTRSIAALSGAVAALSGFAVAGARGGGARAPEHVGEDVG
jgi:hypothetical protein